jgi:uncharacterized protein (TIGR02145 family)
MEKTARIFSVLFLVILITANACKKGDLPILTTTPVTSVTTTTVMTGGNITDDGGSDITARGVCWNTTGNPTTADKSTLDGTGSGSYSSNPLYLLPDKYYYLRAYATNKAGTAYGDIVNFTTQEIITGTVDDIDGNTYKTVVIGSQIWMAENLKTTRYNDGTDIPLIPDKTQWASLISPGLCWYDNNASTYKETYGGLYNWYAINNGNLCPSGWHVPSDAEWTELAVYLGSNEVAGDKMKETGNTHWINQDAGATNESGFTALPGGGRIAGDFIYLGESGGWWATTPYDSGNAYCVELDNITGELLRGALAKNYGFSVRCVKLY